MLARHRVMRPRPLAPAFAFALAACSSRDATLELARASSSPRADTDDNPRADSPRADGPAGALAAAIDPARAAVLDAVVAMGEALVRDGCADTVMGARFRGAQMLCLAAASLALAAVAIEDPTHAPGIRTQLDALVGWTLEPRVRADFAELPSSVLYRGLAGLMIVAAERVGSEHWSARADSLARELARDLDKGFIASYRDGIWPCDHAPAAAFLRLHGRHRAASAAGSTPAQPAVAVRMDAAVSARAADALLDRLRALLASEFPTRLDQRGRVVDGTRRTTTLAFTASFLLPADPELARAFAETVVESCDRAPAAACREWKTAHRPDRASGPIIGGYSVGATGLAIIATRALPDPDWNRALLRTAELAAAGSLDVGTESLAVALFRLGEVARAF